MMSGAGDLISGMVAQARTVHDENGRELTIRTLTALDRLRLFKAVGSVLSQNTAYLGMAMLAYSVTAIEGVPVPVPASEGQIESLISKLGDSGVAAAADALELESAARMDGTTAGN